MENQTDHTIFPLAGRRAARVCGVAFPDSTDHEIDLVFLQLQEPQEWYRFCLGEGVAYCDVVSNESVTDEIQEYQGRTTELMDCNQDLIVTLAHEFESEAGSAAQISIDFSNGLNLGFRCRRGPYADSTEVVIRPIEQAARKIAE